MSAKGIRDFFLVREFFECAKDLFEKSDAAQARFAYLAKLVELYR